MGNSDTRELAPHVRAAIAATAGVPAQGKLADRSGGSQGLAPHVRAAIARTAQPPLQQAPVRPGAPAPHVRAAIAAGSVQPRLNPPWPHARPGLGRVGVGPAAASPVVQASARSESCEATLYIGGRRYDGETGRGHGHAEMDALHDFIDDMGGVEQAADALQRFKSLKVKCESRPVCSQCGAVLEAMGFVAYSEETKWGSKTMGSTEWAASMNVQALLALMGIDYKEILRMRKGYAL